MAEPGPETAVGVPGVPGTDSVTDAEAADADDVPPTLVAVEVKVYEFPDVSPVTSHDVEGAVTVHDLVLSSTAVTKYDAGVPPVDGGVIVTVDEVVEVTTAVGVPGVPGAARGVTAAEATDAGDVPALFVAVDVNVYDVPLVSPETVQLPEAPLTVHVAPPGEAVTV